MSLFTIEFASYVNVAVFFSGLEFVINQLKSLVLSFALIDRHLNVEEAVLLSRLEEEYQVWLIIYFLLDTIFFPVLMITLLCVPS